MVSGAQKLWINPVLRSGPAAMLGRPLFCLYKAECREPFSDTFAGRRAETVRLKTALLAFACIERFIRVPEPAVLVRMPVGEVAQHHEKVALGVRERPTQRVVIKSCMRREEEVRVLTTRRLVRLIHVVH